MRIEARLTDPLEAQLLPRGPGRLRVGLVIPQSGALGMVGPSAVNTSLLAAHELNVSGGVRGAYVDLVLVDGGRSPAGGRDRGRPALRRRCRRRPGRVPHQRRAPCHRGHGRGSHAVRLHAAARGRRPRVPGSSASAPTRLHQLRLRDRLADRAPLAAPLGADRQRLHLAAERAPRRDPAGQPTRAGGWSLDRLVPLGQVHAHLDRLVEALRRSGADAVLLSLVGRDLAAFNSALRQADLDRRLVRLSGALEENGLLALRRRPHRHALRRDVVVRVARRRAAPRRWPERYASAFRPAGAAARHLRGRRLRRRCTWSPPWPSDYALRPERMVRGHRPRAGHAPSTTRCTSPGLTGSTSRS